MTTAYLERDPRTLRQTLDETQAEIASLMRLINGHYKAIDTLAARVNTLEERAAGLGEALIAQHPLDDPRQPDHIRAHIWDQS